MKPLVDSHNLPFEHFFLHNCYNFASWFIGQSPSNFDLIPVNCSSIDSKYVKELTVLINKLLYTFTSTSWMTPIRIQDMLTIVPSFFILAWTNSFCVHHMYIGQCLVDHIRQTCHETFCWQRATHGAMNNQVLTKFVDQWQPIAINHQMTRRSVIKESVGRLLVVVSISQDNYTSSGSVQLFDRNICCFLFAQPMINSNVLFFHSLTCGPADCVLQYR